MKIVKNNILFEVNLYDVSYYCYRGEVDENDARILGDSIGTDLIRVKEALESEFFLSDEYDPCEDDDYDPTENNYRYTTFNSIEEAQKIVFSKMIELAKENQCAIVAEIEDGADRTILASWEVDDEHCYPEILETNWYEWCNDNNEWIKPKWIW